MRNCYSFVFCTFFLFSILSASFAAPKIRTSIRKDVVIKCQIGYLKNSSQVIVQISGPLYGAYGSENVYQMEENNNTERRSFLFKVVNHSFKCTFKNITSSRFITLDYFDPLDQHSIHSALIIEPGDSIIISNKNNNLAFSGKNSQRYACIYGLAQIKIQPYFLSFPIAQNRTLSYFQNLDSIALKRLAFLKQYEHQISKSNYSYLMAKIIIDFQTSKYEHLTFKGHDLIPINNYLKTYKNRIWNDRIKGRLQQNVYLSHDLNYLNFILIQYKYDALLTNNKFNIEYCYSYIANLYTGAVREWMIYSLIRKNLLKDQNISYCIADAFKHDYIKNVSIKGYLTEVKNKLPGAVAFNFSLPDTSDKLISQSSLKGKVILIDTWHNPCPACRSLHPILDSIKKLFNPKDFAIVSICMNFSLQKMTKTQWLTSISTGKYTSFDNINLLLDEEKNQAFIKNYKIEGDPTLILIDKNGKITEQPEDPRYDNGKSLVRIIKQNL